LVFYQSPSLLLLQQFGLCALHNYYQLKANAQQKLF